MTPGRGNLARFFEDIAPLLLGEEDVDTTRARLYPRRTDGPDARRLVIYARFCRSHRHQALDGVYTSVRKVVQRAQGEHGWSVLVAAYFRAHPMSSAELNENGAHLPVFLETYAPASLPAYTAALADLCWSQWRTRVAPDDPRDADPCDGPIRVGSTVTLRPYGWDLCAWLDDPEGEPEARANHVLFWRDLDLDDRREPATPLKLLVLKGVLSDDHAPPAGVSPEAWRATFAELRAAGILLGRWPKP